MTKPANFPERKRQRRLRALDRLSSAKGPKRKPDETDQQYAARMPKWRAWRDAATRSLIEKTKTSLRDVRTKKYRGAGREFERGARQ